MNLIDEYFLTTHLILFRGRPREWFFEAIYTAGGGSHCQYNPLNLRIASKKQSSGYPLNSDLSILFRGRPIIANGCLNGSRIILFCLYSQSQKRLLNCNSVRRCGPSHTP